MEPDKSYDNVAKSPLSPRNFDVQSIYNSLNDGSIESILLSYDYISLGKIIVQVDTGEKYAKYMIAINRYGQVVIIDLDIPGGTTMSERDFIIKRCPHVNLPRSIKFGSFDMVGNEVTGILFIYDKGVITIETDVNYDIIERSYEYIRSTNTEHKIIQTPVPHVIVKMSEIQKDPSDILARINKCTINLRLDSVSETKRIIDEVRSKFSEISDKYEIVYYNINEYVELLLKNIRTYEYELNTLHMKDISKLSDSEYDRYKLLLNNLTNINDTLITLIEISNKMNRVLPMLENIYSVIKNSESDIEECFDSDFDLINKVYDKLNIQKK